MIYLTYKDVAVTSDTYIFEFINSEGKEDLFVSRGMYSYARILIFAMDYKLSGKIIYPMTRSKQRVVDGFPIHRGRKSTKKGEPKLSFVKEIPSAPASMK